MAKILIIDDERSIRNTLRDILEFEKYIVDEAQDGIEGFQKIQKQKYDVILCDIKMPKLDGIDLLQKIQQMESSIPIIMISGHGNIETAVEAVKKGAYDFIQKPLDLNRLLVSIRNAIDRTSLINETKILKRKIHKGTTIIGNSVEINRIKEMIEKVAPTDARVLITGENGTGKELVARLLHEKSSRSSAPIIEVNCAAIPAELIESELFGHEKGAFTSAISLRKGKFEQAEGGTLFLDEIGDMSLSAQAKVLRALQENKISRVGSEKEIKVNVRVIAATNKDLKKEIEKGNFREDLFHRLNVINIHVPALNDRKSDIPLLIDYFLDIICNEYGITVKKISEAAIKELQNINWTGNIRELRNIVERLIILGENPINEKDIISFAKK